MLFWRGWHYTVDVLYCYCVSPFSCSGDLVPLYMVGSMKNVLNVAHVLRLMVIRLYSLISSLKVAVCAKRVIHLDTIIELEII